MSNLRPIVGRWISGPHAGHQGSIMDARSGLIYVSLQDGSSTFGRAADFMSESGETGDRLLAALILPPRVLDFFAGTVRESLASAGALAKWGRQETRTWEHPRRYVVDDNEGNAAVVHVVENDVVGAVSTSSRRVDTVPEFEGAPEALRGALSSLLQLPLLRSEGTRVTAVFWSEEGRLVSAEPWFRVYLGGMEIFRRELLSAESWTVEAMAHYELNATVVSSIVEISKRASVLHAIELTADEVELVLPSGAPHRDEAAEQLREGGLFMVSTA